MRKPNGGRNKKRKQKYKKYNKDASPFLEILEKRADELIRKDSMRAALHGYDDDDDFSFKKGDSESSDLIGKRKNGEPFNGIPRFTFNEIAEAGKTISVPISGTTLLMPRHQLADSD